MLKTTPKSQCINPVNLLLRQTTATGRELSSCSHSAVSAPCVRRDHLISTCHSRPLRNVKTEREEQCKRKAFRARSGFAFARISLATTHLYAFDLIQAGWATQLIFVHWAKRGNDHYQRWEQTFLQRNLRICFTLAIRSPLATSMNEAKTSKISDSMLSVAPDYLYKCLHLEFV